MYITTVYEIDNNQNFNWDVYFNNKSQEHLLNNIDYKELFFKLRELIKEDKFAMTFALSRVIKNLLEGIKIENPEILELGAATGFLTRWLLNKYSGSGLLVDNCEESYNSFKSLYNENEQDIKYIVEDIFNLKSIEKFDIVCSFGLIEHFKDKKEVVEVHKKFAKSDGLIIILIPLDSILTRSFFELHPEQNLGYRELLTQNEFRDILLESNLEVIKMEKSRGYSYDFIAAVCKKIG